MTITGRKWIRSSKIQLHRERRVCARVPHTLKLTIQLLIHRIKIDIPHLWGFGVLGFIAAAYQGLRNC